MHPPATLPTRSDPTTSAAAHLQRPTGLQQPSRRVATARARYQTDGAAGMSGGRLLVALYQRLLRDLVAAETAIEANQIETAHLKLVHAQEIVDSLDDALDHEAWDQADRFAQIYGHLRRELVRANVLKDASIIARCRKVLEPMSLTWQEALAATAGPAAAPSAEVVPS